LVSPIGDKGETRYNRAVGGRHPLGINHPGDVGGRYGQAATSPQLGLAIGKGYGQKVLFPQPEARRDGSPNHHAKRGKSRARFCERKKNQAREEG